MSDPIHPSNVERVDQEGKIARRSGTIFKMRGGNLGAAR
jgi:hypothetical protein